MLVTARSVWLVCFFNCGILPRLLVGVDSLCQAPLVLSAWFEDRVLHGMGVGTRARGDGVVGCLVWAD